MSLPNSDPPYQKLIGQYTLPELCFSDKILELGIHNTESEKRNAANKLLFEIIQKNSSSTGFFLPVVIQFIEKVKISFNLSQYHFTDFERWLNQSCTESKEKITQVRGKIAGRNIPRQEYQLLFPIGMDRTFKGYHFVTAHMSPDIDTSIASFWGWVDAFSAKVAEKEHIWNLPSSTTTQTHQLFETFFGKNVLEHLPQYSEELKFLLNRESTLAQSETNTASLRDFCNGQEIKVPSNVEVISVVDHHKVSLSTSSAPVMHLGDAQSCNVLLAELAFALNDKYSIGGLTLENIESQLQILSEQPVSKKNLRCKRRLLQKKENILFNNPSFFVDPHREFTEYLFYLIAILDDTDLLSKVSTRDVNCIANLINRMSSLLNRSEIEVVDFDDIPLSPQFAKQAAKRLLQSEDLYSVYKEIYEQKERDVESDMLSAQQKSVTTFFADTKEQNGLCRVGQSKIFAKNYSQFTQCKAEICANWIERNVKNTLSKPSIDLYMHAISTVTGAEEVYSGQLQEYTHKDEMWIWIADTEQSEKHLRHFLHGFLNASVAQGIDLKVSCIGPKSKLFKEIIYSSNSAIDCICDPQKQEESHSWIVFTFKAGSLNSRKAAITPFLPK